MKSDYPLTNDAPLRSRQVLRLGAALLSFCSGTVLGATVTEGPWTLYRGTSIVQPRVDYASLQACVEAADKLTPRTYTCRTIATVVVSAAPPPPVNCEVSDWSAWQAGAWGACSNGQQSRTETRTRTITTQPANGGQSCPVLTETRTVTQTCAVAPTTAAFQCWSPPLNGYRVCADGVTVQARANPGNYGDWSGGTNKLWQNVGSSEAVYVCELALPIGAGDGCPTPADASARYRRKSDVIAAMGGTTPTPPATGTASLSWQAPAQYTDGTPLPATGIAGYRVYQGTTSTSLARVAEVAGLTYRAEQLPSGQHYFAVSAVSTDGAESALSPPGSKAIP